MTIFERLGNLHGLAHTENHLGMLYMRLGQWGEEQTLLPRARPHLQKACEYWQANQDEYGLVYGYSNLGMYYLLSEQPDEALRYSGQALEYAQRVGGRRKNTARLDLGQYRAGL